MKKLVSLSLLGLFIFSILVYREWVPDQEALSPFKIVSAPTETTSFLPHKTPNTGPTLILAMEPTTDDDFSSTKIEQFVANQAFEMNRIQNNPEQIDHEFNTVARNLTSDQAKHLASISSDPHQNQNERIVAIDLLTRQPLKNQAVLLAILARKIRTEGGSSNDHQDHKNMFESALSLQVLRSLEEHLLTDHRLRGDLFLIAKSDIPETTKESILRSLIAAQKGRLFWNEIAGSFTEKLKP